MSILEKPVYRGSLVLCLVPSIVHQTHISCAHVSLQRVRVQCVWSRLYKNKCKHMLHLPITIIILYSMYYSVPSASLMCPLLPNLVLNSTGLNHKISSEGICACVWCVCVCACVWCVCVCVCCSLKYIHQKQSSPQYTAVNHITSWNNISHTETVISVVTSVKEHVSNDSGSLVDLEWMSTERHSLAHYPPWVYPQYCPCSY